MHDSAYRAEILAAYQGEIGGEALFSRLLEVETTPALRQALACMLQLEGETKLRLRPLLQRLDLSLVEPVSDREAGRAWADRLLQEAGPEWPARLADQVDAYVQRYDALRDRSDPGDRESLAYLAAHERALWTCLRALSHQPVQLACAAVVQLLSHPVGPLTS